MEDNTKKYLADLVDAILYTDMLGRHCSSDGGEIGGCLGGDACEDCEFHNVDNYYFSELVKKAKEIKKEIK